MLIKNKIHIIGCVGPSGSGKSKSCLILEFLDIYNINTDIICNKILFKSIKFKKEMKVFLNKKINFLNNQNLKLEIINTFFLNKYYLKCFNSIVKKYVIFKILDKIFFSQTNKKICVIDAPILFEYNLDKLCDSILLIRSKNNFKLKRISIRESDKKKKYLNKRMQFQYKEKFYFNKYNNFYYINNTSSNFELFLNLFFFIRKKILK